MAERDDLLSVELEIVTPLFLGGPNPSGPPELRPPSVRGSLRFWWRAWHEAREPSQDANALFAAESRAFGSTDAASPLVVRLVGQPRWTAMERAEKPAGLNYLLYGMHKRQPGPPVRLAYRRAWASKEKFRVILASRLRPNADGKLNRDALAALWLLCNLGGLGARTRRGAGALRALSVDGAWPEDLPPLDLAAHSPKGLCTAMSGALTTLLPDAGSVALSMLGIPTLHPKTTVIGVFDRTWRTWEGALEAVGESFRLFRSHYDRGKPASDYFAVKEFIQRGKPLGTVKRAAFGLPLQFRYRSLPQEENWAKIEGLAPNHTEVNRSASPLYFHVVRLAGEQEQYTVLLLAFILRILPPDHQLSLVSKSHKGTCSVPDQRIFAEYIDFARAQEQLGPWLDVRYG